ncbi:putative non-heme bromoperoxidase BpoC [compost metagenome]
MSYADSKGVRLYVESTGSGTPIVFIHEFAGDLRNWEYQVRTLGRRYRCITFNSRGYPPSDVPQEVEQYSQELAVADIASVLRHCNAERAHVVGLSMGGYTALNFAIAHPEMTRSVVAASVGHGSDPDKREAFLKSNADLAVRMLEFGMQEGADHYLNGPARRRFKEKNPRGSSEFNSQFAEHSPIGAALTKRGLQLRRPTVYELKDQLARLAVPTLVIAGDDDDPCLDPSLFLKRTIPDARLWIVPRTTHTVNLEEPEEFSRAVTAFLADVDSLGR